MINLFVSGSYVKIDSFYQRESKSDSYWFFHEQRNYAKFISEKNNLI